MLEKTHFGAQLKFKLEVKFFTSLYRRLISSLLDRSGGVIKTKKNDYLTDIMLFNLSLKVLRLLGMTIVQFSSLGLLVTLNDSIWTPSISKRLMSVLAFESEVLA